MSTIGAELLSLEQPVKHTARALSISLGDHGGTASAISSNLRQPITPACTDPQPCLFWRSGIRLGSYLPIVNGPNTPSRSLCRLHLLSRLSAASALQALVSSIEARVSPIRPRIICRTQLDSLTSRGRPDPIMYRHVITSMGIRYTAVSRSSLRACTHYSLEKLDQYPTAGIHALSNSIALPSGPRTA